jgi:hypothetical protein
MEDLADLRAVRTIDEDGPELIELLPGETSLHFQPSTRQNPACESR